MGGEHAGDPSEITDLARRLCPPPHPAIYRRRAERGEILGADQGFFTLLLIASVTVPCRVAGSWLKWGWLPADAVVSLIR